MSEGASARLVDLAGQWQLDAAEGELTCAAMVPGDAITALHRAGLIEDPYFGRNEHDLRWIAEEDWLLSRTFTLERTDVVLRLTGLDTVAEVRVNGVLVLEADNAFREWRVDLSAAARLGQNEIEIAFPSSVAVAADRQAEMPFFIPYQESNSPIPNGNMLRKMQCDFGWDWNIALAPFGLNGSAEILAADAPRIDRLEIAQEHQPGLASLTVTAYVTDGEGQDCTIAFAGQALDGVIEGGGISAIFDIENPALWWPAGHGEQVLHELVVQVGEVQERRQIGLRQIELVTEEDTAGRSFGFRVNGRMIFAKGANWIPADALAGNITEAATRDLLQSAAAAHMNMLRVWGGGRYEPDSFYQACDELGLMVWQDFMFACNLYPSTPAFLDNVDAEVRQNVARLHHHACIALWCGDNELIGALNWFAESRDNRDRYLVNYDRLNRAIEAALIETDPAANWWPSSPSPGVLEFGDAWHDDGAGDMHFWSVWHEGRDFDHYRDVAPRFCSEFGFQSYPSMEVIAGFAEPKDWNIASPVFESHQKNQGGNARIAETMFRYFRWPEKFADFVWLSQIQQGLAIKTAVSHWRSLKPHCMGTLYWQLGDTWPVCSWSSLDHGGGWKMLHHLARDFYAPVTVVAVPEKHGAIRLVGVNDKAEPVTITVTAWATAMDGEARALARGEGAVGEDAETLVTLAPGSVEDGEVLTFGWQGSDGSGAGDIFAPLPWKAYDLPDAQPQMTTAREDGDHVLRLTVSAMSFFLTAEASVPGRWDRNAIHLGPGATATLRFTPDDSGAEPTFTLRDLHCATCQRS